MAQQGGLGTGKVVCLGNLWRRKDGEETCGSARWSRHRKDGAPRKLVAQQGGLGTGKMVCLGNLSLCKVVYRHRKDGAPKKLVAQQGGLGAGKMVCLGNLWLSKVV